MPSFDLFIALRYSLGHRRDRLSRFIAGLSSIGLVLGVAIMVTVLSVMNGFDRELREKILVVVPHIKLYNGQPLSNWQDISADLKEHPDVISVHPYTELEVLARIRNLVEPILLYAVEPEAESSNSGFGEILGQQALQSLSDNRGGLLLGYGAANRLGVEPGEELSLLVFGESGSALRAARFEVIDIVRTGTQADQRLAITSLQSLAMVPGQSVLPEGIRVQTSALFRARLLATELLGNLGFGYRASTWDMTHGPLYQAIQMSRNLVGLIVFLILGIAAFNLIATLIISSADKQNELAILKTIGATPKSLARIFALQGLVIGVMGAGIGALLGVLLSSQVTNIARLVEQLLGKPLLESTVYPLDYLPSDLSLTQVAYVVLVAILLSVLAALYPAWKVSRVDPAEVLRYE